MTTIAFDGKTLAGDKMTGGAYIEGNENKVRAIGKSVFGCAGDLENTHLFFKWLRDGGDQPEIKGDFEALEARGKQCWWYGTRLVRCKSTTPSAIGSGCQFAMGAMLAGASSIEAVKIASKLDPGSGKGVRAVKS